MNLDVSALVAGGFMPLMVMSDQGGGELLQRLYVWSARDGKPMQHYVSRITLDRFASRLGDEQMWLWQAMYEEMTNYIVEHGLVGAAVPGTLDAAALEEARQWWARTARFHNRKANSRLLY